jgi:hypothetical protein
MFIDSGRVRIVNGVVEESSPSRTGFTKELCVLAWGDEKLTPGTCSYTGRATVRNGNWVFPALKKTIIPSTLLKKRSVTSSNANAPASGGGVATTASPEVGDKVSTKTPTNTVSVLLTDDGGTTEEYECRWQLGDESKAVYCHFSNEYKNGVVFEFDVDPSAVDSDFECFKNVRGKLTVFDYRIIYNQFFAEDGRQIGIKNAVPGSVVAEGSPVNFLVVRAPHTKLENVVKKGILSGTAVPTPLDADPTTLLYEMPKKYLNTAEGYMNHRDLKMYWMENERKNVCGIVVGTGNLPCSKATADSKSPKGEVSSSGTPSAKAPEPKASASSVAGEKASASKATDDKNP